MIYRNHEGNYENKNGKCWYHFPLISERTNSILLTLILQMYEKDLKKKVKGNYHLLGSIFWIMIPNYLIKLFLLITKI